MITGMTNEEILQSSNVLKECCATLKKLIENKESEQLEEFIDLVEMYAKYIDNTIKLTLDADKALQDLIELKK